MVKRIFGLFSESKFFVNYLLPTIWFHEFFNAVFREIVCKRQFLSLLFLQHF